MTEPRCTGTKVCSVCEEEKHALCFAAQDRGVDGLHSECRECASKRHKQAYKAQRMLNEDPLENYLSARRYD